MTELIWFKESVRDACDHVWLQIAIDQRLRPAVVLAVRSLLYAQAASAPEDYTLCPDVIDRILGERKGTAQAVLTAMEAYGWAERGRLLRWERMQSGLVRRDAETDGRGGTRRPMTATERSRLHRQRRREAGAVEAAQADVSDAPEGISVEGGDASAPAGDGACGIAAVGEAMGAVRTVTDATAGATPDATQATAGATLDATADATPDAADRSGEETRTEYEEEKREATPAPRTALPPQGAAGEGVDDNVADVLTDAVDGSTSRLPAAAETPRPRTRRRAGQEVMQRQDDWDVWYAAYPRHVNRQEAVRAWNRLCHDGCLPPLKTLLDALSWQKRDLWAGRDEQYVPYPGSWLNARRWQDEQPSPVRVIPRGGMAAGRGQAGPGGQYETKMDRVVRISCERGMQVLADLDMERQREGGDE